MTTNNDVHIVRQENLRYLLNQWDPLRVADFVDDEYDCLLAPIWQRLSHGANLASLSEYLWFEIKDHFGMDPVRCGTDAFAEKLLAWHAATS